MMREGDSSPEDWMGFRALLIGSQWAVANTYLGL